MPPPGAMPGAPGGPSANPYVDWADQVGRHAEVWGAEVGRHAEVLGQQVGQWGEQLRQRIVNESQARAGQWGGPTSTGFTAPAPPPPGTWASAPPPPGWTGPIPPVPPAPPVPPINPQMELERARREPIGAIVLILLGMLFLLNTMGFFSFGWVGHGWPWIIVAIGVWLIVRNTQGRYRFHPPFPPPPPPQDAGAQSGTLHEQTTQQTGDQK